MGRRRRGQGHCQVNTPFSLSLQSTGRLSATNRNILKGIERCFTGPGPMALHLDSSLLAPLLRELHCCLRYSHSCGATIG